MGKVIYHDFMNDKLVEDEKALNMVKGLKASYSEEELAQLRKELDESDESCSCPDIPED